MLQLVIRKDRQNVKTIFEYIRELHQDNKEFQSQVQGGREAKELNPV